MPRLRPPGPPVSVIGQKTEERRDKLRTGAMLLADGACECCRHTGTKQNPLEVDHVKPRSRYPNIPWDDPSNVQILCRKCNRRKGYTSKDYRKGAIVRDILWVSSK